MNKIDEYLKEFVSYTIRKKIYAACALVSLAFASVSGAQVVENFSAYPTIAMVFSIVTGLVSVLAKANATPDETVEEEIDYSV